MKDAPDAFGPPAWPEVRARLISQFQKLADFMRSTPPWRPWPIRLVMRSGLGGLVGYGEVAIAMYRCWDRDEVSFCEFAEKLLGERTCNQLLVAELAKTPFYKAVDEDHLIPNC